MSKRLAAAGDGTHGPKTQREKSDRQIERMLDEANRLMKQQAREANPSAPAIPRHLLNQHVRQQASAPASRFVPSSSGACASASAPRKMPVPASASGRHSADGQAFASDRDKREAKRTELEQFHSLLLSLDLSLEDKNKAGANEKKAARQPSLALKGRFSSNQEYCDTYGPLVLEEIRAELLQERVEQGPSSFRPAMLKELQNSLETADFHYFTLALDMSHVGGSGKSGNSGAMGQSAREFYDPGDAVLVQMQVLARQKAEPGKDCALASGCRVQYRVQGAGCVGKNQGAVREGEAPLSPITRRALELSLSTGAAAAGGQGGCHSASADAAKEAKRPWRQKGRPLEFLAVVMHARKRGGGQSSAGERESGGGASFIELKMRAVRSLNLERRMGEGAGGTNAKHTGSEGRVVWKVMRLKNMGPAIREWRAVGAVRDSRGAGQLLRVIHRDVLKELLRPSAGSLPTAEQVDSVFANLNPTVVEHIKKRCNPSQLCAVAAACAPSVVGNGLRANGGFTLLQGPPGTGKTTVILQILNFLHLLQYQRYYDWRLDQLRAGAAFSNEQAATLESASAASVPHVRTGGGSGSLGNILNAVSAQRKGDATGKSVKKPRILVCAPSNAAVDLLVERLLRDKLRDANGFYTPDMLRVGSPSACSERVRDVTLDYQVEKIIARGAGALDDVKNHYRVLMTRREKLRKESRGFRGELPRGMDQALIDVGREIERAQRDLAQLQILGNNKKAAADTEERSEEVKNQLRSKLLEDAQIVFTTLNSSGQEFFSRMSVGFHTVIIDEACQAVEASTLIPLLLDVRRCILVGDPKQLPATVISNSETAAQYQRSLFERLMSEGHVTHVLDTQYRMHPHIRRFPSDYFYSGVLRDGPAVLAAQEIAYQADPWFGALRFFDLQRSRESRGAEGMSLRNKEEAELVAALCKELFRKYSPNGELRGRVCVLTPYRQQRAEIIHAMQREIGKHAVRLPDLQDGRKTPPRGQDGRKTPPTGSLSCGSSGPGDRTQRGGINTAQGGNTSSVSGTADGGRGRRSPNLGVGCEAGSEGESLIDVMTVDACQGQERDIVIMSCVRANARGAVGFVQDVRRMNVALTRAKHCLLVVGNAAALTKSEPWRAFIQHAKQCRCVTALDAGRTPSFHHKPPEPPPDYFADADGRDQLQARSLPSLGRGEDSSQKVGGISRVEPMPLPRSLPQALGVGLVRPTPQNPVNARLPEDPRLRKQQEARRALEREEGEVLSAEGVDVLKSGIPRSTSWLPTKEIKRATEREEGEVLSEDEEDLRNACSKDAALLAVAKDRKKFSGGQDMRMGDRASRGCNDSRGSVAGDGVDGIARHRDSLKRKSEDCDSQGVIILSSDDEGDTGSEAQQFKRQKKGATAGAAGSTQDIQGRSCGSANVTGEPSLTGVWALSGRCIRCETCQKDFWFSEDDRQRLLEKGLGTLPSRCKPCRMGPRFEHVSDAAALSSAQSAGMSSRGAAGGVVKSVLKIPRKKSPGLTAAGGGEDRRTGEGSFDKDGTHVERDYSDDVVIVD